MYSRNRISSPSYQLGQWHILPARLKICGPQGQVTLPAKVFEVLKQLIGQAGETITREQFIDTVWRGQKDVGDKALNQAIWQLRRAFAETGDNTEVIGTVARMGYVLQYPVTMATEQEKIAYNPPWRLLLILLLVPAMLILWLLQLPPPQPAGLLNQRPVSLTHYKGAEETPAFTADGRFMAFQWDKGNGVPGVYMVDLEQPGSSPFRVSSPEEYGASPAFSPDGSQLAFAVINGNDCRIKIQPLHHEKGHFVDQCHPDSLAKMLSWSGTGNMLAYAYKNPLGGVSIRGYNPDSGEFQQLSLEQGDYEDYPLVWAHHSETLAYVSQKSSLGNIYLRDKNGRIRSLLKENQAIYSLAWSPDDNYLYFSTVWQSEITILQVSVKDGSISPLSYEATPGRISVRPGKTPQLVYPRYSSLEQLFRLKPGASPVPLPFSYGRELYPAYSASQQKLVFFSNKSSNFQLWEATAENEFASKLADIKGSPYIHAVSNKGDHFLLPVKQPGDSHYSLYIGSITSNTELQKLPQINYSAKNFSWGKNDLSLLFSSDLDGQWQIWRHHLDSSIREQLTLNGGLFAIDGPDNELYYVKPTEAGIWRVQPTTPAELMVAELGNADWGNWLLQPEGILYLQRTDEADLIKLRTWDASQYLLATLPPRSVKAGRSITQLADGSLVVSMYQSKEADIVAVDL